MTTKLPRAILRACIFCGGEPTKKNREHVLAQWLLQLTGDPNRQVDVTFSWQKRESLQFAFDAYVAPACTACNDRYSELEDGGRAAVLRLLECGSLSGAQITTLLSWLDKVRVGVWRLNNVLAAGALAVEPTFGIDARIDRSDRALAICRLTTNKRGLTLVGTSTPLFHFMPSCFGLCINGLALLNVSTTGLLGRRAGFPWLERRHNIESGLDEMSAHAGDDVLQPPLVKLAAVEEFVRVGSHPMLCQWALKGVTFEASMYTDWVKSHMLRAGLGRPILGVGGEARHLLDDEVVPVVGDAFDGGIFFRAVLESQIELARAQTLADGTLRPSLVAACALTQKFVDSLE